MADEIDAPESAATDAPAEPVVEAPEAPVAAAPEAPTEDVFMDPASMAPELKAHWKRMNQSYQKALQKARSRQADIDLVDRYRSDPNAARQFIESEARRMGLSLSPPTAPAATP